jgi:hypothetical protein
MNGEAREPALVKVWNPYLRGVIWVPGWRKEWGKRYWFNRSHGMEVDRGRYVPPLPVRRPR